MNISKLLMNMTDQIVEAQMKLGYSRETITLYYPLDSLNRILGTDFKSGSELAEVLLPKVNEAKHSLGTMQISAQGNRIGVVLPPEASEYVHENADKPEFLAELIRLFEKNHHCTIEEITELFGKYSRKFVCQKMPEDGEFDYVLYFPEHDVDNYYYCIRMEMGHTIYHRFLEEDYREL